ncbi:MAG: hypothetical protein HY898_21175 [Deltaproteobacteria bacterium]|nr:hypothetical protein [Deltaproteobacteria bacterium]
MQIDKTRFLALVSMLSSGLLPACGAAPAAAPAGPAPTSPAAVSSPGPAAPVAGPSPTEPATQPPAPAAAPADPPAAGPTADAAKACDEILIGPCGEGGTVRSSCRSIAMNVDDGQRSAFLACVTQGRGRLALSDAACGQSVSKCQTGRAQCETVNRQLDACRERASTACNAAADKQMECLQQCLGNIQGQAPQVAMAKFETCKKKCGDPDTARGQCERSNSQRDCRALEDSERRCHEQPSRDCDLPQRCQEPLARACQAGFELMRSCETRVRGSR